MSNYTLAAPVQVELEIRKSRFIGLVTPVKDRGAAMEVVRHLREEHRAATHVCWALMAGGQSGMSDDGEPSGTAGRPMLEVLRHHELDGVLAAVVRYYGGIKLGAGGLVRAYTDAVAAALMHAERVERIAYAELDLECDYADEARVRRWIEQHNHVLAHGDHGEAVRLQVSVPAASVEHAQQELRDLTQGRVRFRGL
ncbi:MAG: YigZ family protein [Burkholderiaceae bacterium]